MNKDLSWDIAVTWLPAFLYLYLYQLKIPINWIEKLNKISWITGKEFKYKINKDIWFSVPLIYSEQE